MKKWTIILLCVFLLAGIVQGFVQVGDLEFRLLVNVSQIYRFKLMIYSFAQQRSVELGLKLN